MPNTLKRVALAWLWNAFSSAASASEGGQIMLQLVRETKGGEDLRSLQFPHERRKVEAAKKPFRKIGVNYRVVSDDTPGWWRPSEEMPAQPWF